MTKIPPSELGILLFHFIINVRKLYSTEFEKEIIWKTGKMTNWMNLLRPIKLFKLL